MVAVKRNDLPSIVTFHALIPVNVNYKISLDAVVGEWLFHLLQSVDLEKEIANTFEQLPYWVNSRVHKLQEVVKKVSENYCN